MTECFKPPKMPICEKCGTEKLIPPLCSLPACPKCDVISAEEAERILGLNEKNDGFIGACRCHVGLGINCPIHGRRFAS